MSTDDLVARYLAELQSELRNVPPAGRREVVQEIAEHIAAARAELGHESEAEVRTILDRVGDPVELAADARERFGIEERRSGWREIAAVILLPFGGVIIPFAGWFVGVFFLWLSQVWTTREKLLGTFVLPFGLLPLFFSLVYWGGGAGELCGGPVGGPQTCTGGGSTASHVFGIVLGVLLLLLPLASMTYLATRLRRR